MASITGSLQIQNKTNGLRPFDVRRDLGPVADLIQLCFANSLDADGERYIQRMHQMADDPGLLRWASLTAEWSGAPANGFVWEEAGRIVGNLTLISYLFQGHRQYLIANVAVHPDFRRRGIARQLTAQALETCRQRGCPSAWLHVREDNPAAVSLYQSLNFSEHFRRSSWQSEGQPPAHTAAAGVVIGSRRPEHWKDQRRWLETSYPHEVTWHLPLRMTILRPGLWGTLSRLVSDTMLQQWSLVCSGRLAAVVAWQSISPFSNTLWLAAPPDVEQHSLAALLLYARSKVPQRRSLTVDYPAGLCRGALHEAGFTLNQTLIWMKITF